MKIYYSYALLKNKEVVHFAMVEALDVYASVDSHRLAAKLCEQYAHTYLLDHPDVDADQVEVRNWEAP